MATGSGSSTGTTTAGATPPENGWRSAEVPQGFKDLGTGLEEWCQSLYTALGDQYDGAMALLVGIDTKITAMLDKHNELATEVAGLKQKIEADQRKIAALERKVRNGTTSTRSRSRRAAEEEPEPAPEENPKPRIWGRVAHVAGQGTSAFFIALKDFLIGAGYALPVAALAKVGGFSWPVVLGWTACIGLVSVLAHYVDREFELRKRFSDYWRTGMAKMKAFAEAKPEETNEAA